MFLHAGLLVLSLAAIAQGAPRVMGGHEAPNHQYPYQVSMRYDFNGRHMCSGSILNKRWILTAHNCVGGDDVIDFTFSAGTNFLNETGTVLVPDLLIRHEKYQEFHHYDIALVRLKEDIVFNDFIQPINLPTEDLENYNQLANFAGWGTTENDAPTTTSLREIFLNVLSYEDCKKLQPAATESHICTLNKRGEGICWGDAGGPLVVNGVQVGIASYIRQCAKNHPDVYTRVFAYRDWILDNMQRYDKA